MKRQVIFLHGSYFHKNFGDFLLLERMRREIVQILPDCEVVLPFAAHSVLAEFSAPVRRARMQDFFVFSHLILAGGGYLGEPPTKIATWSGKFLLRHALLLFIARLLGRPIYILGVGAGPISKSWLRWFVGRVFRWAKVVVLRDQESVAFARDCVHGKREIKLGTDLAQDVDFLKSIVGPFDFIAGGKFIAVHVPVALSEESEKDLRLLLQRFLTDGYQIVFFTDNPSYNSRVQSVKDRLLAGMSKWEIERCRAVFYSMPRDALNIVGTASGVITSKLHVGIVSCTLGVPVVSFPAHHKTVRYYRHIGHEDWCCELINDKAEIKAALDRFYLRVHNESESLKEEIVELHTQTLEALQAVARDH